MEVHIPFLRIITGELLNPFKNTLFQIKNNCLHRCGSPGGGAFTKCSKNGKILYYQTILQSRIAPEIRQNRLDIGNARLSYQSQIFP